MAHTENWYAMKVRPGFESRAASVFRRQGVSVFAPCCHESYDSDTAPKKLPIPGLLFGRLSANSIKTAETIPGVLCVMGVPKPKAVPENAIDALKAAIESGLPLTILPGKPGSLVEGRIVEGPLKGREGLFVERNSVWYLAVPVNAAEKTFAFSLKKSAIEILRSSALARA